MGFQAWHAATIEGQGIEIAIIDYDFRDFDTRILPRLKADLTFLCFSDSPTGPTVTHGVISPTTPPPTLPADFAGCLDSYPGATDPHGTSVLEATLDIAPEATYYIANANSTDKLDNAVEWLTAKTADDADTSRPYRTAENNTFQVDIINYSQAHPWEGPGDGSPVTTATRRVSALKNAEAATQRGVLWVNAAGNYTQRTWFKRNPTFNPQHYLEFDPASTADDCNEFTVEANQTYDFKARYSGNWGSENKGINLHIQGPRGVTEVLPAFVAQSMNPQDGLAGNNPFETVTYHIAAIPQPIPAPPTPMTSATYCLWVSKHSGDPDPDWIQIQMFSPSDGELDKTNLMMGSIINPAESINTGVIAVGATDSAASPVIKDFSSRGPVPEPHPNGRIEPDIVAPNTTIPGTSFAAPRVAALAALPIQALGHLTDYDQPSEIAQYLKDHATQHGSPDPNNQWGHGLATLPGPTPPQNVMIEEVTPQGIKLTFDHTLWDAAKNDHSNVNYRFEVRKRSTTNPDGTVVSTGKLTGTSVPPEITVKNLEHSVALWATVQTCPSTGALHCSPMSSASNIIWLKDPRPKLATTHEDAAALILTVDPLGVADTALITEHQYEIAEELNNVQTVVKSGTVPITEPTATVNELTQGKTYRARTRPCTSDVVSICGAWSAWSAPIELPQGPSIPKSFVATPFHEAAILTWDHTFHARYEIQQEDPESPTGWRRVTSVTGAGIYMHPRLQNGTELRYRMRAVSLTDGKGSPWSDAVTVTPEPPANPTSVTMTGPAEITHTITLRARYEATEWGGPGIRTAIDNSQFGIYYGTTFQSIENPYGGSPATQEVFSRPGEFYSGLPRQGDTYRAGAAMCVVAYPRFEHRCSEFVYSTNTVSVPTLLDTPENVQASADDRTITVMWDAVENAQGYRVLHADGTEIGTATGTTHTIQGATRATRYHLRVQATSATKVSRWSAIEEVDTRPIAPKPTGTGLSRGRVYLEWEHAEGVKEYKVLQWRPSTKDWPELPFQEEGHDEQYQLAMGGYEIRMRQNEVTLRDEYYVVTSAGISNLTDHVEYFYKVVAKNDAGETESSGIGVTAGIGDPPSDPPAQPPKPKLAPRDLTFTLSGTTVNLTWTGHTNPNYTTQQVLRRVAGERPIDWTTFSVDLSATSYTDTTAVSGTTYIYRVEALKANGKGGMTNPVEIAIP